MSFRRFWPQDRIERFEKLRKAASRLHMRLKIRNAGSRTVPLFYMSFWRDSLFLGGFFDIAEAETWLAAREVTP